MYQFEEEQLRYTGAKEQRIGACEYTTATGITVPE